MSSPSGSVPVLPYPSKSALEVAFGFVQKARVPHIPEVVLNLRQELAKPDPDLRRIADLITQDPLITGDLLKAINSPLFNPRTPITSVAQATTLMGVTRLTNYVTTVAIKRLIEGMSGRVRGIWEDIQEEARIFAVTARLTQRIGPDEAYLFGVMHDVGSLVFASQSGDYVSRWAFHSHAEPGVLVNYEQTTFGVDHATLGFLLATNWRLPEHLTLAISHHHQPVGSLAGADDRAIHLITLSKLVHYLIALARGTHELPEMLSHREEFEHELDLGAKDWTTLCECAQTGQWD